MLLVQTAARQECLSGLCELLRTVAEISSSFGCVLWELAPYVHGGLPQIGEEPRDGRLYVLAQWFHGLNTPATYNLGLDSVTGSAILEQKAMNVGQISTDQRVRDQHPFLKHTHINSFCSAPLTFLDGRKGALNLYRATPFTDAEVERVVQMAWLVPELYGNIRDKISFRQIRKINGIMQQVDMTSSPTHDHVRAALNAIVESVADTFQSIETSLYLRGTQDNPAVFDLTATSLKKPPQKKQYRASSEEGLTGWILSTGKKVRLFDFNHFERDRELIQQQYAGIVWKDSLDIQALARERLGLGLADELPPLSFMGCPIMTGHNVLGVIRCAARSREPHYYSERELALLEIIAEQIGHFWVTWLNRREIENENESWRLLVMGMSLMNNFVQKEIKQPNPDVQKMFESALRSIRDAISGADAIDVRLADETSSELRVAAACGRFWEQGSPREIADRRNVRVPLAEPSTTIGARVMRTGLVETLDVSPEEYPSEIFPGMSKVISTPVSTEEGIVGVLGVQSGEGFGRHTPLITELLAQQLGLYHSLASTIRRRYRAEMEQLETFEELQHQLKTPIQQAHARMRMVLQSESLDERLRLELQKVRGLCGKVRRVAMSLKLFSDLSKKRCIEANRARIASDSIVKMLIEAASDNALMVDAKRQIRFSVERESFRMLNTSPVLLDLDLLEQAVNNLLDNAGKYSYANTLVKIYGGVTGKGKFHISVSNKGIPIRPKEALKLAERGWRGEDAQATGDGTGIGLWIVDHIMRAHDGQLLVIPSNPEGMTEFKLMFPVQEKAIQ
jgi:signal transduction histidine kinase